MASKNDKTSKTARVMNLLSKKPDPAASPEEAAAPAAQTPIAASMAPDAAVSVQIKNALEDALEGEQVTQQAAPRQAAPAPVQQAAPAPQPEPEPAPAPEPEPAAVQPQPEPEPAPAAQPEAGEASKWDESHLPAYPGYMNVMQVLVEEKAPKYVQMFGLCSCERCMEDVKALTLNHLPPKYVVLERGDMVPRLTVYESKFSSDITAQLLQACKLVMERPHHGRE
ncbi:MAG: late competence development ComFB family protein [Clostridiales bacterium]|nr:late competence development ComFB family protein [Clostridiales bacterium]